MSLFISIPSNSQQAVALLSKSWIISSAKFFRRGVISTISITDPFSIPLIESSIAVLPKLCFSIGSILFHKFFDSSLVISL